MRTRHRAFFPERWRALAETRLRDGLLIDSEETVAFELWCLTPEGQAWNRWLWLMRWLRLNLRLRRDRKSQRARLWRICGHARHIRVALAAGEWQKTELPYLRAAVECRELEIEFLRPLAAEALRFRPAVLRKAQFLRRARELACPSRDDLLEQTDAEFSDVEDMTRNKWADEIFGKRKRGRPRK